MPIQTRKLHYKALNGTDATLHIGNPGDVFFDPTTTTLRISDGTTPGGNTVGGDTYNSSQFIDYGDYSGAVVAINLTKKYHWMCDLGPGNYYTLADGTDGQELVFLASNGLMYGGVEQSNIIVNSMSYYLDSGGGSKWDFGTRVVRLFSHAVAPNAQGMVKALFLNGAWHFQGIIEELGAP